MDFTNDNVFLSPSSIKLPSAKPLRQAIKQATRDEVRYSLVGFDVTPFVDATLSVATVCGEASQVRSMLTRIGLVLLHSRLEPTILAPVCPDYSHNDGKYTLQGLGNDVSFLAQKQIAFLDNIARCLPSVSICLLIADQEALDPVLQRACGITEEQFRERIDMSLLATTAAVRKRGWNATKMTVGIPNFLDAAALVYEQLLANPKSHQRLTTEAMQRRRMYQSIDPRMSGDEMVRRTARTAAQYLVLGRFAATRGYLLSNHTTTNLGWYKEAGAAVLHNPIAVY